MRAKVTQARSCVTFCLYTEGILNYLKVTSDTNTNKIQEKICAEILYKPVKNSYKIIGLIFSKF